MRTKKNKSFIRKTAGAILSLLGFLLVLTPLVASLGLLIPRLFGIQMFSVSTGSMEPIIPTGSLIFVRTTDFDEIREGDVISFYMKMHSDVVVTHRVTKVDPIRKELTTKGDANQTEDINKVRPGQVIGVIVFSLPYAGIMVRQFSTLAGVLFLFMAFLSGTLLVILGKRML